MSTVAVNIKATATLTDNSNNPIGGENIDFAYKLKSDASYTSAGSATTAVSGTTIGQAVQNIAVLAPEEYDVQATFNGTTLWQGNVTVASKDTTGGSENTSLTATVDATDIMSGQLFDSFGHALPAGQSIDIAIDGTHTTTVQTDSSGNYSYPISTYGLTIGTHTAAASFAQATIGGTIYLHSSAAANFSVGAAKQGYGLGFPANISALINGANHAAYQAARTLPVLGDILPPPPLLPE